LGGKSEQFFGVPSGVIKVNMIGPEQSRTREVTWKRKGESVVAMPENIERVVLKCENNRGRPNGGKEKKIHVSFGVKAGGGEEKTTGREEAAKKKTHKKRSKRRRGCTRPMTLALIGLQIDNKGKGTTKLAKVSTTKRGATVPCQDKRKTQQTIQNKGGRETQGGGAQGRKGGRNP